MVRMFMLLAGEEAEQFWGYSVALMTVVWGGVSHAVQYHSSRVRQDPAEAVRLMAKSRAAPRGRRGVQRIGDVRSSPSTGGIHPR